MSVPEGKRGKNTLEAWQSSAALARYTLEITSNRKTFPGRYQALTDRINETAIGISEDLWLANNIYVGKGCDERSIRDRLYLQNRALSRCRSMLHLIDLAGRVLHRPTRKTMYWAAMAKDVLDAARAWHESDARRLRTRDQAASSQRV